MDKDVNARNTSLYNKHANQFVDKKQALGQREVGMAAPLKRLHNKIKRLLLQRFALNADRLLDLACGRGGDLHKWVDCGVRYVRGYDIADGEVAEATTRFGQLCGDRPDVRSWFRAEFLHSTDIGDKVWAAGPPYDAVTCMFALHYFFSSEHAAKNVVSMAAANLRPGGYFFGVLPDGKNVVDTIGSSMRGVVYPALRLAPRWKGQPAPFGSAYTCALTDTVTEGGDAGEGSHEYLVFQKVLIALAKRHDLHPVVDYDDYELDELLDEPAASSDGSRLFRRFKPQFPSSHPSLMLASQLNCAFVFRKGTPDDGAPAGAGAPGQGMRGRVHEGPAAGSDMAKRRRAEEEEEERPQRPPRGLEEPQFKRSSRFKVQ